MSNSSSSDITKFYCLNRRYMRSLDSTIIMYEGGGQHVILPFKGCTARLVALEDYIDASKGRLGGGLRSPKDLMMLELIAGTSRVPYRDWALTFSAAQLSDILVHWREAVARPARYGTNSEVDTGMCVHAIDVDICDGLDTLKALEAKAEAMGVVQYKTLLVPKFKAERCKCNICEPSGARLRGFWKAAQKYHHTLPSPVFERMFASLREDAEATYTRT